MRNYQAYLEKHKGWKLWYFKNCKVILSHHVKRLFGVMIGRALSGNCLINHLFSTRWAFFANGPIKESMPQDALKDLLRCMHFADDWEESDKEWAVTYADERAAPAEGTAKHRRKFAKIEDAFNRRWQSLVHFGWWLTADKSRIAGWYHSPIPMEPESKLI